LPRIPRRHGDGEVVDPSTGSGQAVSRDANKDDKLGLIYPVRVRLDAADILVDGKRVSIAPGHGGECGDHHRGSAGDRIRSVADPALPPREREGAVNEERNLLAPPQSTKRLDFADVVAGWIVAACLCIIATAAIVDKAHSQNEAASPFEVDVSGASPIARVSTTASSSDYPTWCNSNVVAFQNGRDGRFWTEFYELGRPNPRIEHQVLGSGRLVACRAGGAEQLRMSNVEDGFQHFGNYDLILTGYPRTRLVDQAGLVSTDDNFRTFTFRKEKIPWEEGRDGVTEMVRVSPAYVGGARALKVDRIKVESGIVSQPVLTATISSDGLAVAYIVSTATNFDRGTDLGGIAFFVAKMGQRPGTRVPLQDLLKPAVRLTHMFFDQDKLVVTGATDDDRIVVATCELAAATPRNCRSITTRLSASEFYLVGLGQTGLVFGTRAILAGHSNLRACLFEAPAGVFEAPARCRMHGPSLPPLFGLDAVAAFSVAPDRRHAAVRTRFRSLETPTHALIDSQWSIFPMSVFQVR